MVGCGSKNKQKKRHTFKEIGLHAQILLFLLDAIINIDWQGRGEYLYDHLITQRIFTFHIE